MSEAVANTITPVTSVEPRRVGWSNHSSMLPHASSDALTFPLCDAAVRSLAEGSWKLADAIVAECSEPGDDGVRNGSQAKMEAMRQEIVKNHGVELSVGWIRKLRRVASAFPPGRRRPGDPVEVCLEAGTPEALDEFVTLLPAGVALTRANIRDLKRLPETAEQVAQKEARRRQNEDHRKALQNVCRQLERENEELLRRYTESCRSAGKEPEPFSPPLAPTANSITFVEDLVRGIRLLLVSHGIEPAALDQAIGDFVKAVLAQRQ